MLLRYITILLLAVLFSHSNLSAQRVDNTPADDYIRITGEDEASIKRLEKRAKQQRRDSIRATKKVWWSILGGPSYTPEASFGIGGAALASFRMNKNDSVSQRSFLPAGFNLSLNGTLVVAGAGTLFFNENRFRIYVNYGYRNEPSHYYGKGYETIDQIYRSDSTTLFTKQNIKFYPRFVWMVRQNLFLGTLLDVNYSKSTDVNPLMAEDPYFNQFDSEYLNVGIGGLVQYDTRDDVATPSKGVLLSATASLYSKQLGGKYNYALLDLEYRQFVPVFRPRSTVGWVARSQISAGDVPFTELPTFGSPFDLRGYLMGQYRDKSMAYSIVEYRHMFGSVEKYKEGSIWAKLGFVAWAGVGTIGNNPVVDWSKWKFNYGAGLRIQLQPGKNFRFDVGKDPSTSGVAFYMNMTEAF